MSNSGKRHIQRVADYAMDHGCSVCGEPFAKLLRRVFDYSDGNLIRKVKFSNRAPIGSVVGTLDCDGYLVTSINKRQYKVHHLVWLWHGNDPVALLDHADGCVSNNRIENLRPASKSQNSANSKIRSDNKSGAKGVSFDARRGKWRAYITKDGVTKSLGYFTDFYDAESAYVLAALKKFGDFARIPK